MAASIQPENLHSQLFFFPARLQGTVLATSLLQAQHSTAALAPSSSSTKALHNLHV